MRERDRQFLGPIVLDALDPNTDVEDLTVQASHVDDA